MGRSGASATALNLVYWLYRRRRPVYGRTLQGSLFRLPRNDPICNHKSRRRPPSRVRAVCGSFYDPVAKWLRRRSSKSVSWVRFPPGSLPVGPAKWSPVSYQRMASAAMPTGPLFLSISLLTKAAALSIIQMTNEAPEVAANNNRGEQLGGFAQKS